MERWLDFSMRYEMERAVRGAVSSWDNCFNFWIRSISVCQALKIVFFGNLVIIY